MNWFSKSSTPDASSSAELDKKEKLQKKIFVSTFAMIAKMAGADGTVSKKEVESVERFMDQVLELDGPRKEFAIKVFNKARKSETTFRQHAEDYKLLLKNKPEMYEWMVDMLARFSLADKEFVQSELDILHTACEVFGVPEARYRKLHQRVSEEKEGFPQSSAPESEESESLEEYFAILESSPEDSFELVQERYESLALRYQPERIEADGLPEEFQALAAKKLAEVREAFKKVSKKYQS